MLLDPQGPQAGPHHIVLFGGGLDSTAVLLHLIHERQYDPADITLFHVNYGQKAATPEMRAASHFACRYGCKLYLGVLDLSFSKATIMAGTLIGNAETNRLELRNLALLSYAASYGASLYDDCLLHVGFHVEPEGSGFADAKTDYLHYLNTALYEASNRTVEICAPLSDRTRQEILEQAYRQDVDIALHSYTCYEAEPCGKCTHCVERKTMFSNLTIESLS